MISDISVNGPVMTVECYGDTAQHPLCPLTSTTSLNPREIVYGTSTGLVGQLNATAQDASYVLQRGWWAHNQSNRGGIQCIAAADVTNDGVNELVVGRDDGTVEVFAGMARSGELVGNGLNCLHTTQTRECITNLACGSIMSPNINEIVVSTFSGKVFCLSPEANLARGRSVGSAVVLRPQASEPASARFKSLTKDIESLKEKVDKERRLVGGVSDLLHESKQIHVRHTFTLHPSDSTQVLRIECDQPLGMVCIRSDVPDLEVLDSFDNDAILAVSSDPENPTTMLCTLRCQKDSPKIGIKMRCGEKRVGSISVYVVPKNNDLCAKVITLQIKPLCLHQRLPSLDVAGRHLNELTITGAFSLSEAHAWILLCLPDVSEHYQDNEVTLLFKSTLIDTVLVCIYRPGSAVFQSYSISTISTIKEVISREATSKMTRISSTFDIKPQSIEQVLRFVEPKIAYQRSLGQKVELIDALKEITLQENGEEWMSDEYASILRNADKLTLDLKNQQKSLNLLYNVLIDLFLDKWRFAGRNMSNRVDSLKAMLESNYDVATLSRFYLD
eukprot:gnl/Spiro4/25941_TR12923_c0_g1_i1.p1 gnl/Spiro4/25941_TR12923_c0_g1~~gnl/Spiro4/25941_TR12923_c0_g1_i1.p1  ORF type:complete len:610 (+),score=109.67 gnl/Spiro4/25941_TR12923_c0_g1_i1:154-1830(+)